jgi:hypothetical protein
MLVRWNELQPETRDSIEMQPILEDLLQRACGCAIQPTGARLFVCLYHEGYDDAMMTWLDDKDKNEFKSKIFY